MSTLSFRSSSRVNQIFRLGDSAGRSECPLLIVLYCGLDKISEQRMRFQRPRLQLGMELNTHKPGVVGDLDNFNEFSIGRKTGKQKSLLHQHIAVDIIKLETVAMPFGNA